MYRSTEDEKYVSTIGDLNDSNKKLRIIDCRGSTSAYLNSLKSGGTESLTYYKNCEQQFCGIGNIHVMRHALQMCFRYSTYHEENAPVQWLGHVGLVLQSSMSVAQAVFEGTSILIHCSDGWDRTAQLSSLAQIILDPYCRTVTGFEKLIEKEWVCILDESNNTHW